MKKTSYVLLLMILCFSACLPDEKTRAHLNQLTITNQEQAKEITMLESALKNTRIELGKCKGREEAARQKATKSSYTEYEALMRLNDYYSFFRKNCIYKNVEVRIGTNPKEFIISLEEKDNSWNEVGIDYPFTLIYWKLTIENDEKYFMDRVYY